MSEPLLLMLGSPVAAPTFRMNGGPHAISMCCVRRVARRFGVRCWVGRWLFRCWGFGGLWPVLVFDIGWVVNHF
eukprot:4294797-Alexandrium_andersonii.AAC.1